MTTRRKPVPFHSVFTTRDLTSAGVTTGALTGWRLRREVQELAPGVYVPAHIEVTESLKLIHASRAITEGRAPLTIAGAAALFGIATPPDMRAAHHRLGDACPIPADCLVEIGGLISPSPAWTALQLTRWQRLEGALISLDSVLRNGVTREELLDLAARMRGWPGTAALQQAVLAASALAGSALESYSRGLCIREGLPLPVLQYEFHLHGRRYLADFCWVERRVVGEADGTGKYVDSRSVYDEKRRQSALHAAGFHVVRWGWAELRPSPDRWLAGMRALLR